MFFVADNIYWNMWMIRFSFNMWMLGRLSPCAMIYILLHMWIWTSDLFAPWQLLWISIVVLLQDSSAKNVKDVALDPMQEAFVGSADWPMEFGRLQKTIIGLWQACNMPLVHRTYFFLLFRGDPADSIYMEVEFRRLTFMKEMFADEGQAMQDGRTITLATRFFIPSSLHHMHWLFTCWMLYY